MTVPIYAVAVVIVLATCFSSDLTQERPKHIMAVAALSVVSLAIVAGVENNAHVRYAFLAFGRSHHSKPRLNVRRLGYLGLQSYDFELLVKHNLPTRRKARCQHWSGQVSEAMTKNEAELTSQRIGQPFISLWLVHLAQLDRPKVPPRLRYHHDASSRIFQLRPRRLVPVAQVPLPGGQGQCAKRRGACVRRGEVMTWVLRFGAACIADTI